MKVLVTGGAGYIGSTICSALLDTGHVPIILDSLISGKSEFTKDRIFYKGDIADKSILSQIFNDHKDITHTIHCAALIVVPESVEHPYEYYRENVSKSNEFFKNIIELGCKKIVFSSSASIYATVSNFMVTEASPIEPKSPYARTKYMMEMILEDFCAAYTDMKAISLRYFNPIGADPLMRSGNYLEHGSHVLAKLVDTALGKNPYFQITGTQWPTRDGSGIRDYIHVWDLALAHVKAVENFEFIFEKDEKKYHSINLGTGRGVTVKELLQTFEKVYEKSLEKKEAQPRFGDVAGAYANAQKAFELLNWKACKSIEDGIRDALKWIQIRKQILNY